MIKIIDKKKLTWGIDREYVTSCPFCLNEVKWLVHGQLSPYHCLSCGEKMPDFSYMITQLKHRMNYHFDGEDYKIQCASSVLL